MKESMLKSVRREAGLGNPPREYTNNDPEAANLMVKHALNFDPKSPEEFINEIRNIVETQFRNEDRAVFGKGQFKIRPEFQHLAVSDQQWSKLTKEGRMKKLQTYLKSGMAEKRELSVETAGDVRALGSASEVMLLPVTASSCGITSVPSPILTAMFDKANHLLQVSSNVVPKPGATDGSFIVAGYGNTIHVVTPGKGGSLKCDRACVNFSTSVCEHVLAVAQVRGTFKEFLNWYRKSKKGPRVLEMALGSGPKNAGKKPSRRKRTNKEKAEVTKVVDLLEQRSLPQHDPFPVPSFPSNVLPVPPPSRAPATGENIPEATVTRTFPQVQEPTVGTFVPNVIPTPEIPQPVPVHFPNIPGLIQFQEYSRVSTAATDQANSFWLKWLPGTRVSRCYGCNREIVNPPNSVPDDLIVAYRDIRQYRQRNTGQLQFSNGPQNVHFHLRAACIRARYPNFPGASALVVPNDMKAHFRLEHIQRLYMEFGWSPQ